MLLWEVEAQRIASDEKIDHDDWSYRRMFKATLV